MCVVYVPWCGGQGMTVELVLAFPLHLAWRGQTQITRLSWPVLSQHVHPPGESKVFMNSLTYLSICLSIHLSVHLSTHPSVHLSACSFTQSSIHSIYPFIHPSIHSSIYYLFIYLITSTFVHWPTSQAPLLSMYSWCVGRDTCAPECLWRSRGQL